MRQWWLPLCLLVPFALASVSWEGAVLEEGSAREESAAQVGVEVLRSGEGPGLEEGEVASFRYRCVGEDGGLLSETQEGKPLRYVHQSRGRMIRGWVQGVEGMRVGEWRRVVVPPELAYGAQGAPPAIAGGTTLVFEVERVS